MTSSETYSLGLSCIGWTLIWLLLLVVVPGCLWGVYKNHILRKTMILHKRGIHLSSLSCVICILWLAVAAPLCFLTQIRVSHGQRSYNGLLIAHSIGRPTLDMGVFYVLFIRFFMLYFHHNWTAITLASPNNWIYHVRKPSKNKSKPSTSHNKRSAAHSSQLSSADATLQTGPQFLSISPPAAARKSLELVPERADSNAVELSAPSQGTDNSDAMKHSWFVQKRAKYGNARGVLRKVYFGYVVSVMVVIGLGILAAKNTQPNHIWLLCTEMAQLLYWLAMAGGIAFLWRGTPKTVPDPFFYREEMTRIFYIVMASLTTLCASCVVSIAMISLFHREPERELFPIYLWGAETVCLTASCIAICYVQTFWVHKRIRVEMARFSAAEAAALGSRTVSSVDIFYNKAPRSMLPATASVPTSAVENTQTGSNKTQQDTQSPEPLPEPETGGGGTLVLDLGGDRDEDECQSPPSPAAALTFLDYLEPDKQPSSDVGGSSEQLYAVLLNILRMRNTLDLFLRHLASELSMECGFAFIEFTQFLRLLERDTNFMQVVQYAHHAEAAADDQPQHQLQHQLQHQHQSLKRSSKYSPNSFAMVRLPESIPRTSIVHNRAYSQLQPIDRYRKVAQKLAQKYLESSAEFELCIHQNTKNYVLSFVAAHCRRIKGYKKLRARSDVSGGSSQASTKERSQSSNHSLDGFSNDALYHLFEPCRKELYSLMEHSCHRYVKHKQREQK